MLRRNKSPVRPRKKTLHSPWLNRSVYWFNSFPWNLGERCVYYLPVFHSHHSAGEDKFCILLHPLTVYCLQSVFLSLFSGGKRLVNYRTSLWWYYLQHTREASDIYWRCFLQSCNTGWTWNCSAGWICCVQRAYIWTKRVSPLHLLFSFCLNFAEC